MSRWTTVILASAAAYALKLLGYLVPERWLSGARTVRATTLMPVALLAALVTVQTFAGSGGRLVIDARVAGLLVAVVLLWRRANLLIVMFVAAAVTALLRSRGWH